MPRRNRNVTKGQHKASIGTSYYCEKSFKKKVKEILKSNPSIEATKKDRD